MKINKLIKLGMLIFSIFSIVGCTNEVIPEEQQEPIEVDDETFEIPSNEEEIKEQINSVTHTHGLAIDPKNEEHVLLATHHGLVRYEDKGQAFYLGEMRDDFMGFSRVGNTDYLMTSGHPGHNSELPDPLGFLWSEDGGQSWEIRSLLGEYDFHALTASYQTPSHIIGWALDFRGDFPSVILESFDQGFTWEPIEVIGLPLGHHDLFDLAFSPQTDDVLFAATSAGLMQSFDNARTWATLKEGVVSAINVLSNNEVFYYHAKNQELIHLDEGVEKILPYDFHTHGPINYISSRKEGETHIIFLTTINSSLLVTTDEGKTWEVLIDNGNVQ